MQRTASIRALLARPSIAPGQVDEAALLRAFARYYEEARSRWPAVTLSAEQLARHLGPLLGACSDPGNLLEQLETTDLFLAAACLAGDREALEIFERKYFDVVDRALRKLGLPTSTVEETKQGLREMLFVRSPGGVKAPLMAKYSGVGKLRSWVRVVATREALRRVGQRPRELSRENEHLERVADPSDDPELAYLKHLYLDEFKAAFHEAISRLDQRGRVLLRQHVIDGLSIQQLARLYGVHKATTARWLQSARDALRRLTRDSLQQRLGVDSREYRSVMRLIDSHLDLSLHAHLDER